MPRRNVNDQATTETRRKGAQAAAESKRRKRDEERALLAEGRREHLDDAIEKLSAIATKAADAIEELLGADSEAVKLRAALGVLELLDAAELREMGDRLSRLEEIAGANGRLT
jgi:hypothetical protein